MRERRVGRGALPARFVAGAAGVAALVTAAPPVHAQDEESGGGDVLCSLHDPRLASPSGIAAASGGDGWWIVPSAENQDATLSVLRVGADCNPRESDEVFINHQPRDPQGLALDPDGFIWVGDTGDALNREWITVNQIEIADPGNNVAYRYVFPGPSQEVEAFLIPPGDAKKPLFITATEGEATLFYPPGENQTENTPLENVGTVALSEGGAVTGAALNADATKAALRTATAVYEWTVADGDVIAALTETEPLVTPIADDGSPQDLAYDADGNFHTLAATDGGDGVFGTITAHTPAAPAAEEPPAADDTATEEAAGPSLLDRILDLGFDTIVKILAGIAILGMLVMVLGIIVIRKHRKAHAADEDDDELEEGFAAEGSDFGADEDGFISDLKDDPVDLGLDSGHPDPDLGEVARGGVYGTPRSEPTGSVYGAKPAAEPTGNVYGAKPAAEPTGNVYGAARPEPTGNVYGAKPAAPASGVYGAAREEPQYGAFEGGGHGSVYDNASPGQSFSVRPEPTGSVYGAKPAQVPPPAAPPAPPAPPASGNVYGGGAAKGSVYGGGNDERAPEADEGYWGPPENGPARGRGR